MSAALRFPAGLYGVTPEWDDTERLVAGVTQAAAGGMRALQLRRKNASASLRRKQAHALAPLCASLGVTFMINDDWQLALEVGAQGVHLGREDDDPAHVRREVGHRLLIGVSCYDDAALAQRMILADVDYVAFGAVYPSPTKPLAVRAPLTLFTALREHLAQLPTPRPATVAIGGITADNAAPVVAAGADSLAVITGLFDSGDITAAARRCLAAFSLPA